MFGSWFTDSPAPRLPSRWGFEATIEDIRTQCRIGTRPLATLREEAVTWGRSESILYHQYPEGDLRRFGGLMFYDRGAHFHTATLLMAGFEPPVRNPAAERLMEDLDLEGFAKAFLSRIGAARTTSAGQVAKHRRELVVTLGRRRGEPLDEATVAEGLFLLQGTAPAWHGQLAYPTFYGTVLAPHFHQQREPHPFRWALARLSVHLGYAHCFAGDDHPPTFAEHGYTVIAPLVCNVAPTDHRQLRRYSRTASLDAFLGKLGPGAEIPEIVAFSAENTLDQAADPTIVRIVQDFAERLPTLLDNGLNIDRVSTLYRAAIFERVPPATALQHATSIASKVFGGADRPWWFHEDCSLLPPGSDAAAWSTNALQTRERLAAYSGFAYRDVVQVYGVVGPQLVQLGIAESAAIATAHRVVQDFGIGNPDRAVRTLTFAVHALEETPEHQRESTLTRFLAMLNRYKPPSPLLAALEGANTDFEKPGYLALLASQLGEERIQADKLNPNKVRIAHHREVAHQLGSRTYSERAALPACVGVPVPAARMRGLLGAEMTSAPPATPSTTPAPLAATRPFSAWLHFEERLARECSSDPGHTASQYFTFYALKFPDPLKPPPGFLRFLEAFDRVRDPDMEHTFLHHPNERENVRAANTAIWAERNSVVSTILDAWVLDLISWGEALHTFEWLLGKQNPDEQRAFEMEALWKHREDALSHYGDARALARRDLPLLRKLEALQRELERAKKECPDEVDDVEWQIARVVRERAELFDMSGLPPSPSPIFDDDLTEPSADPEHAETENLQAMLNRSVESARSEVTQTRANGRLFYLRHEVEVMQYLLGLTARGVLARNTMQRVFPLVLANMRQAVINPDALVTERQSARQVERLGEKDVENLTSMCSLGILSQESLDRAVSSAAASNALRGFVRDVQQLLVQFTQTSAMVQRLPWRALQRQEETAVGRELLLARAELAEALASKSHHLGDGALGSILREHHWRSRYADAARTMAQELRPKLDAALPVTAGQTATPSAVVTRADRNVLTWVFLSLQLASSTQVESVVASAAADKPRLAPPISQGTQALTAVTVGSIRERLEHERSRAIQLFRGKLRDVVDGVVGAREANFGLLPIGGKIHVRHPISTERFDAFRASFGFDSTSFRLIHAGHSLIIPATVTPAELKYAIAILEMEGVVKLGEEELQFGVPGRLPPGRECAILGAAVILSSDVNVRYHESSFDTTQNEATNFRVIVYDRDGPRDEFPFSSRRKGRTDILARRSLGDADHFHLVASVLGSELDGGPFQKVSAAFRSRFESILHGHGLHSVLDESWVHALDDTIDTPDREAGLRHFHHAVAPCVSAWEQCRDAAGDGPMGGVVGDVQQLFDWLRREVYTVQEQLLRSPEFASQRRVLLGSIRRVCDV